MTYIKYDYNEEDWNEGRAITSGSSFNLETVKYINLHYTGAPRRSWTSFKEFLNRTNNQYWNRTPVGYAFGYSAAVSNVTGETAEGRGLTYRAASNGDDDSKDDTPGDSLLDNKEVFSIIVDCPVGEKLSEKGKEGVLKLALQLKEIKPSLFINGHQDLDFTSCPGEIYGEIPSLNKELNERFNTRVNLGDLEILDEPYRLLDTRQTRGKGNPVPANNKLAVKFNSDVRGALVIITPIGRDGKKGYASINRVTSFTNWSEAHNVNPNLVPIKTKDNAFTIFTSEPAHFVVDVYAQG